MSFIEARKLANELRRDFPLDDARACDLESLLRELEVRVVLQRPSGGEAEAMAFDLGHEEIIFAEPSVGRRRLRFTLAHELGHLLLGHGAASCSSHSIHGDPLDRQEQEANVFAAELLMPSRPFRSDITSIHPRISELSQLADIYDASLTATVLRYVAETDDYCAVVVVREDGSYWFKKSGRTTWFLKLPPGEGTLAHEHVANLDEAGSWEVPAEAWLEDFSWSQPWTITEEVVQIAPGEWLILLSELPDPDDDPDLIDREAEEDLENRRNRFSRY